MRSSILRAALLLVAALLVPACATQKRKNPPVMIFTSPSGGASNVPRQPIIYIRYDKALDPATIPGSYILADSNGTISCTVTYNPALFEVRMTPNSALGADATTVLYQVTALAGIKSADGAEVSVNLFFQFTTVADVDKTRPAFGGISSIDTATSNSLTLHWAANATDLPDNNFQEYRIYMSTSSGTEDLTTPLTTTSTALMNLVVGSLAANTTYFFIVRARDSLGNEDANLVEMSLATLP
jgi:hypothetical protein